MVTSTHAHQLKQGPEQRVWRRINQSKCVLKLRQRKLSWNVWILDVSERTVTRLSKVGCLVMVKVLTLASEYRIFRGISRRWRSKSSFPSAASSSKCWIDREFSKREIWEVLQSWESSEHNHRTSPRIWIIKWSTWHSFSNFLFLTWLFKIGLDRTLPMAEKVCPSVGGDKWLPAQVKIFNNIAWNLVINEV